MEEGPTSETMQHPSNQPRLKTVAAQLFDGLPRTQLYDSSATLVTVAQAKCYNAIDIEINTKPQ